LWPGRRLGLHGAIVASTAVAAVAVCATAYGAGPFASLPPVSRLLAVAAFDLSVVTVSLAVAAASDRCRRALEDVRRSRDRIRRDLHDGLGPTVAAAILQLQVARGLVRSDPRAAEDLLGQLQAQARAVVEDIRRLTFGLSPEGLRSLGLLQAVKRRASHFARVPGTPPGAASPGTLNVTIEAAGDLDAVPPDVELAAFHIVSEALNNASRHGSATDCSVELAIRDSSLVVEVSDNGRGLGESFRPGLGLQSMRMRAEELSGVCTVQDAPGGGTVVRARIPVGRAG
jgi:signal transduction histidine kinase